MPPQTLRRRIDPMGLDYLADRWPAMRNPQPLSSERTWRVPDRATGGGTDHSAIRFAAGAAVM